MSVKRGVVLAIASLFSAAAWSADLVSIYKEALANDAQFASARAQREADQEKLPQGRAGLLPSIGLSANSTYNHFDGKYSGVDFNHDGNTNAYSLQLTQPLFRWQNWVQYKEGELQAALGDVKLSQARQDLILRVSQAYFDVLDAQDALASVISLKDAAKQQLDLAQKSFDVGTVTITDVHEARSRYDLANAQQIAADNDLAVRREALAAIIGKEPEPLLGLRKGIRLPSPQPAVIGDWVAQAEKDDLAVQAQQIASELADREVARERAGHYPTVDLVASYGHSRNLSSSITAGSTTLDGSTIGVQFNMPLFSGGAVSSRVREAADLKQKAWSDLDGARRSAALSARQAFLGVTSGMAQVTALEAALVSSRSSLESNKLGYEVGVRINIDVLNAQSQVADTQQKLAKARYDTLMAQLRLKAAAGTLTADDVNAINGLLGQD